MQPRLVDVPASQRVLRVADGSVPRSTLSRLARAGALRRVLPGTYIRAEDATVRAVRLAAACAWAPGACLWGGSALDAAERNAAPFADGEVIQLAGSARHPQPGIAWYRADVPAGFVAHRGGLVFARPVVAAISLAGSDGGLAIDRLLLRDPAAGDELGEVMAWFDGRAGNGARRPSMREVRRRPWSGLERKLHRLLRRFGVTGWVANVPVSTPFGWFVPDVLFEVERLVVEVDSWEYHGSAQAFEDDRARQNRVVLAGFHVLRFTGQMLDDHPELVIRTIRTALRRLRRA